jgi:hypothetical protein
LKKAKELVSQWNELFSKKCQYLKFYLQNC